MSENPKSPEANKPAKSPDVAPEMLPGPGFVVNYRQETATVGNLTVWPIPALPGANGPINTTLVQQDVNLAITILINGYKIWPPG